MKHKWIIAFSFLSFLPSLCGVPLFWKELFCLGCFVLKKKNEEESVKRGKLIPLINDSLMWKTFPRG